MFYYKRQIGYNLTITRGDDSIDVEKIRLQAIKVLESMAFRIFDLILRAIFLFEKHIVETYQQQKSKGCEDRIDIYMESGQKRYIKYIQKCNKEFYTANNLRNL